MLIEGYFRKKLNTTDSRARGFTILELIMVMTILVILAAMSVVSYQKLQLKAKETLLKENLRQLRKQIDQYAADKEALPQALEDLVSAQYIRDVPIDPITGKDDWIVEMGDDPLSRDGGQGIVDVHSKAGGTGTDGKTYSQY